MFMSAIYVKIINMYSNTLWDITLNSENKNEKKIPQRIRAFTDRQRLGKHYQLLQYINGKK